MDIDKAFAVTNGLLVDESLNGPFYTGGTVSPIGLDLPQSTFYLQTVTGGVLIWRKFGAGVNDWRILSAQDIPIDPILGTAAVEVQTALKDSMNPSVVASASGNTTTTATTETLIAGMSIIAPDSATYLISFQTTLSHGTNNANAWISVYAGGTQVTDSELRFNRGTSNITIPVSLNNIIATVQGSPANRTIEIRWRTSAGTITANGFRYMSIVKIGPVI
jgi:hypothetical protein